MKNPLSTIRNFIRSLGPVEQAQVVASTAVVVTMTTIVSAIIVTGHNPNQSEFLGYLISGGTVGNAIDLKKGAVAKVEYKQGKGTLQWCITPKLLKVAQESASTKSRPKTSRK